MKGSNIKKKKKKDIDYALKWTENLNEEWIVKINWEGIKGLILRHCGKLNFTYHGKLRPPQYMRYSFIPSVLWLVYCGSYILRQL